MYNNHNLMTQKAGGAGAPVVSVIVLTYNQQETISRTLDAILAQQTTYDFEIIIGEDASPDDDTRAVCQAYAAAHPGIVRLLPPAPNKGLMQNYADCLGECRGRYIAGCAGDDWWHNPHKLQMQAEYLDQHRECVLVYTDYDIYKPKRNLTVHNALGHDSRDTSGNMTDKLLRGFFLPPMTAMYRREALEKIDFGQYIAGDYMAEDLPMYLDFSLMGVFGYIDASTATYTASGGSASHFDDARKMEYFNENMLRIRREFIQRKPSATSVTDKQLTEEFNHRMLWSAFVLCDRKLALKYDSLITARTARERAVAITCKIPILFRTYLLLRKIIRR